MSRSKAIGTAGEVAVVGYAQGHGFPEAERLALAGKDDQGDVRLMRGVHLEVKAGNAAHNASYNQCEAWLKEADREGVATEEWLSGGLSCGCHCGRITRRRWAWSK